MTKVARTGEEKLVTLHDGTLPRECMMSPCQRESRGTESRLSLYSLGNSTSPHKVSPRWTGFLFSPCRQRTRDQQLAFQIHVAATGQMLLPASYTVVLAQACKCNSIIEIRTHSGPHSDSKHSMRHCFYYSYGVVCFAGHTTSRFCYGLILARYSF